jgi:hypothetical protein
MAIPFEAYFGDGTLTGLVEGEGRLRDRLEAGGTLPARDLRALALDGRPLAVADGPLDSDELLMVVADDVEGPIHANWHEIVLEIGPYRITAELPTLPGFDPARALARPGGTFTPVREAAIGLRDEPSRVLAFHARLLVNRYEVESVRSELMLGFYFPGARLEGRVEPESVSVQPGGPQPAARR